MYRLRFENPEQIFDAALDENNQLTLPLKEIWTHRNDEIIYSMLNKGLLVAEIPAILWEGNIDKCRLQLEELKEEGLSAAVCENIGAFNICNDLGLQIHGGMHLNILNSIAAESYAGLGARSVTLSFEMPFSKMRNIKSKVPVGAMIYGYLPLMKFRNCPAQGKDGCEGCTKEKYLEDRKNEKFRIMCRDSLYSELLNCVPLYAADKGLLDLDFEILYFTVESKIECEKIFEMVINNDTPQFRRTWGLYSRQLL